MKFQAAGTMLLGLVLGVALGQSPSESNPSPVQAEFLANVRVRQLVPGAKILARVTLAWNGPDCSLRAGSILEATVELAERHMDRTPSRLALSFTRAQCDGPDLKPMNLLLVAMAQPPENWRGMNDSVFKGPVMSLNGNGTRGLAAGGDRGTSLSHLELIGIEHHFPFSSKIHPGAVLDISGLKLEVGTGPKRSSVVSAKSNDVFLDMYTQILLLPASAAFLPGAPTRVLADRPAPAEAALRTVLPAPAPVPANDIEVCAPPGCSVDLPVAAEELLGHDASSIAIHPLGYAARHRKILGNFGNEETLTWVSPRQLLFTFNPHPLIRRAGPASAGALQRVIRAVLIDSQSHAVVRTVDWEITDTHRYLWPLDGKRIVVHVGNELRIYGADLGVERTIPIAGPLSFVRIAPNGSLMAIATLRERHSPELHARLRDELDGEPEEDVDVAVFDTAFNTVARATTVSSLQPPTLLNEGQVNLVSQSNTHYRLKLRTWDEKTSTLAQFTSRCVPELSSVAPDHLFLQSCDTVSGTPQYRVLGADGKLLLRRDAGPREVGQDVIGNQQAGVFAIKIVRELDELAPNRESQVTGLESEEVQVFRVADKKRLLAVNLTDPVASYDNYAVSPDGAQLAVLSQSQIQIFPLPAN
ncbi:MAG TPA: hypothetical protein VGG85_11040 [Terracidiphilus sp.]|jgi:hypothetical protein